MTEQTSYKLMVARTDKGSGYDPDFFPTPPWVTRALCSFLEGRGLGLGQVWEPACGDRTMVKTIQEFGSVSQVMMSDLHAEDYGLGPEYAIDFLNPAAPPAEDSCDWVITNPPFGYAKYEVEGKKTPKRIYRPDQFMLNGIRAARAGCAMMVRTNQLGGSDRYNAVYAKHPPTYFLQHVERPNFAKGQLAKELPDPKKPGKMKKVSGMIDFGWMIWVNREMYPNVPVPAQTELHFLPEGTRAQFERDEDYPAVEAVVSGEEE